MLPLSDGDEVLSIPVPMEECESYTMEIMLLCADGTLQCRGFFRPVRRVHRN